MDAQRVNLDQRCNDDFNTAYEQNYRIAVPPSGSSLNGNNNNHHAAIINEDVKIAIPSPLISGTHDQVANHTLQIDQSTNNRDPNYFEEHDERGNGRKQAICCRQPAIIILTFLFVCTIVANIAMRLYLNRNSAPYYLEKDDDYETKMITKKYGIEFYVKSYDKFNKKYPEGTPARAEIENAIIEEYVYRERRDCSWEIWWHSSNKDCPTPACNKLQSKGIPIFN